MPQPDIILTDEEKRIRAQLEARPDEVKKYIPYGFKMIGGEIKHPLCPHSPHVKQLAFLLYDGLEAFFGGAAGPGKSEVLLMGALQYVQHPHYRAILVRRKWSDFERASGIIPRTKEWWDGQGPEWREGVKRWTFPTGATIELMHMEHADDRFQLKGAQAHFIGFDELSEFKEEMYTYAFRSLRKAEDDPIPLRLRGASNPGGPGHAFCKKRFIAKVPKGSVYSTFKVPNPYNKEESHDCAVMLGTVDDNPALDKSYSRVLDLLNPLERKRQKLGDWDAMSGGAFFVRNNFEQIASIPKGVTIIGRVRAWDLAASEGKDADFTVGSLHELGDDGTDYITDTIRGRWSSDVVEDTMVATAEADGPETMIWGQQDPGAAGKKDAERLKNEVMARFNYEVETVATNVKGAKALRARPLQAASGRGKVKVVGENWPVDECLSELEGFTEDGSHDFDDVVDSWALGFRKLINPELETVESVLISANDSMDDIDALLRSWS